MKPELIEHTNPYPQEYVTKDLSRIRELLHPNFIDNLNLSLAEAIVDAGHSTQKHMHTNGIEIYYCLNGEGTLFIDEKAYEFSKDRFYLIPQHASHYLVAKTQLNLLCICQPAYDHEKTLLLSED